MASIRDLDSFMGSYSVPSFLKEEPTNFAKALSDWQQVQNNYYKNDKARMGIEDKEEQREKNKELEKKKLELGLALDADDIQGSIRKVIEFSKGEGDINSAMSGIGRLYQLKENDKKKADADLRKALGISKKEQKELEKEAKEKKANGYMQQGISVYGFSPEAIQHAATLAIENGDLSTAKNIGTFGKTFFGSGKNSSANDDPLISALTNKNQPPQQPINTAGHKVGDRRTNKNTGEVQIFNAKGEWETVGKVK